MEKGVEKSGLDARLERRLTVSDVFIAGLAILLQPFFYAYGRRRSYFDFVRSKVDPVLFLPVPSPIYSFPFYSYFHWKRWMSGKRTTTMMLLLLLQLSSGNGNFFHPFFPPFFLFFFSPPLSPSLRPKRKSMRHDRRSLECNILEWKMLLHVDEDAHRVI